MSRFSRRSFSHILMKLLSIKIDVYYFCPTIFIMSVKWSRMNVDIKQRLRLGSFASSTYIFGGWVCQMLKYMMGVVEMVLFFVGCYCGSVIRKNSYNFFKYKQICTPCERVLSTLNHDNYFIKLKLSILSQSTTLSSFR
jgi:hypothetical protein